MTIFRDLIEIFKNLQGFKYQTVLRNSRFRKLSNLKFMKNQNFLKVDYDILYKKIETQSIAS